MAFQRLLPRILIILSLLCAGVSIFFQAKLYLPVNDDSCYQHILGEYIVGSPDNDYSKRVETFDDLVTSQINHYLHTNGRAVVHTIVQALIAFGGWEFVIPLFISIVLISTLIAFIFYCYPAEKRSKPLPWILATGVWLLMYPTPDGAFYRLVFTMNYLFPMFMCLCFMLVVRRVEQREAFPMILGCVIAFFTGWSQEGFSFPLCASMLIYLFVNRKNDIRRTLILFLPLFLGALLILLSPGNFVRVGGIQNPFIYLWLGIVDLTTKLPLLWVEIIILLISYFMSPIGFRSRVRPFMIAWLGFVLSMMFSILAHSGPWSMMNVEFYGAIVAFSQLPVIAKRIRLGDRVYEKLAYMLLVILLFQQSCLLVNVRKMRAIQNEFIADYVESDDGIVELPKHSFPILVKPWLFDWHRVGPTTRGYIYRTLEYEYGNPDKPMKVMRGKDFMAVRRPNDFYVKSNLSPGGSPFYEGDDFYWSRLNWLGNNRYEMVFAPVKLSECPYALILFKAILTPDSFDRTMPLVAKDTIVVGRDSLVRFNKIWRTVTEIREIQRPEPL